MHIINERVDITAENKRIAGENRKFLTQSGVIAINIMGAIGSGKTIMIEKIVEKLGGKIKMAAIAGDVVSDMDARRIQKTGIPVVGVNTGKECHLDAHMVQHALNQLDLKNVKMLLIENVGNLICPVDFDLGTHKNVVVISSSEGDDIIEKHPMIFMISDVCIINKIDIHRAVGADINKMEKDALKINPQITVFKCSFRTGRGTGKVFKWFENLVTTQQAQ